MTIEDALKYDKRLSIKVNLDGSKILYRKSPYNSQRSFDLKDFRHSYLGSGRWVRDSLIKMDTQRNPIIHNAAQNNKRLRARRTDDRISRDIAEMMYGGGDTFIN